MYDTVRKSFWVAWVPVAFLFITFGCSETPVESPEVVGWSTITAAHNVVGTLSFDPAYSSVLDPLADPTASFGNVAHGRPSSNAADPFTTITVSALADAQTVVFELALTADGGHSETTSFTLQVENTFTPPTIIAASTTWTSDTTYLIGANTVVMPGATLTIDGTQGRSTIPCNISGSALSICRV